LAESSRCFDRADSASPKNPAVLLQRAGFENVSDYIGCIISHIRNNDPLDVSRLLVASYSEKCVQDLEQIARWNPKDYQAITYSAFSKYARSSYKNHSADPDDATRRGIRDAISRLKSFNDDPDKAVAVESLEEMAMLGLIINEPVKPYLDRAMKVDPENQTAWELWLGESLKSESSGNIVAACESRVRYKDSAQNRLLLSKALTKAEKWDQAAEQAQAALKLETNNITAHLMLAAVNIRRGFGTGDDAPAREELNMVNSLVE
ncbi:MAG TPA: hypothetical protein VH255_09720, partial [Verrucomicrobiae bacterium]|nr:hypothetical protein [Verrucomicrobiae bacterium]